ncbi:uncharacterized membrane protein YbaN (DUF454 family) [Comamonas sp. 4034]
MHNGAMPEPRAPAPPLHGNAPPVYCPIRSPLLRWLLLLGAVASLCMGIVGIFIPGLPTTVFILIAGACAARSSERLHGWLWRHRLFGGMLRNWAAGGFVSRRAKWSATATMAVCALIMLAVPAPVWAKALSIGCMACVLAWLWCRPEPTSDEAQARNPKK